MSNLVPCIESVDDFRGLLVAARSASIHARSAGIAILVSDGNGGTLDDVSAKAQLMKDRGVLVVAVGLGHGISLSTLEAAASWQGGTQLVFKGWFDEVEELLFSAINTVGSLRSKFSCSTKTAHEQHE